MIHYLFNFNSLYTYPFDRPQLTNAYQKIINQLQPGDQLIGNGLREYYLQDLPESITTIRLSTEQVYTLEQFHIDYNQTPSNVFVIYEQEKQVHFETELIDYLQSNAKKISGQGINDYEVEIYYLEK